MSTHVCRLPGSISGSCSASLEPNPDSKIYRTLSSARLRWDRRGNLATTSASLRYWNSARQRYCRQLVRYRKTLASLPTRSPSQQPRPARKAGFSTFENDCGRETDCLLEGDGFELLVPREDDRGPTRRRGKSLPVNPQLGQVGAFHEALVGDRYMLLRIPRQAGRSVPNSTPILKPDYALSSAIKLWYKTGIYGCFCGFERWRATRCNFKRGSARPSLLFFTEQRISAGRR